MSSSDFNFAAICPCFSVFPCGHNLRKSHPLGIVNVSPLVFALNVHNFIVKFAFRATRVSFGSTGFFLFLQILSDAVWRPGISIVGQLI